MYFFFPPLYHLKFFLLKFLLKYHKFLLCYRSDLLMYLLSDLLLVFSTRRYQITELLIYLINSKLLFKSRLINGQIFMPRQYLQLEPKLQPLLKPPFVITHQNLFVLLFSLFNNC